jgi:hypothetical protein
MESQCNGIIGREWKQGGGPQLQEVGHWGRALEGTHLAPGSYPLSAPSSATCSCYHNVLNIGPETMEPVNHKPKPVRAQAITNPFSLKLFSQVFVTVSMRLTNTACQK